MLHVEFREIELKKKHPLAISRGVSHGSRNLFLLISDDRHTGIGEAAPGAGYDHTLADLAREQLTAFLADCPLDQLSIHEVYARGREASLAMPALAALDCALWDLRAKQLGVPLYHLLGLSSKQVPTSVTVGLGEPDVTRERTRAILEETGGKSLKIKLGSPHGLDFDRPHFLAAWEAAQPFGVKLRVDANGGWSVADSLTMIPWLAEHGVDYVEQPLAEGNEDGLPALKAQSRLPIFVDESCKVSSDIPRWASHVQGVNLKLMKCGGISEALRIIATARAHGLKTMIGCMGETSVAIGSGAALGALFDHIDLDSHLNLDPDPATGLGWQDGTVIPPNVPGHGAALA